MQSLVHLFTVVIYQPFFNILVFFYWMLDKITLGHADMGIAVILLTILIRILLLPMSLSGEQTEAERRAIAKEIKDLETVFADDPVRYAQEKQKLLRSKQKVVFGEIFSLVVQVIISLMLWRIFATGLTGEDIHLLYPFMPEVKQPFNLVFLGRFDLTHANLVLNLVQSLMIFLLETIAIYTSPYPPAKGEVVRYQLILPVVSFFIFMFLPAGKKLFIITTLMASILLVLYRYGRRKFLEYKAKKEAEEANPEVQEEKVVVEVK